LKTFVSITVRTFILEWKFVSALPKLHGEGRFTACPAVAFGQVHSRLEFGLEIAPTGTYRDQKNVKTVWQLTVNLTASRNSVKDQKLLGYRRIWGMLGAS